MALLVDGYNAMHEPKLAGLSEAGLCRAIARASEAMRWRGPLRVVCDGSPKPRGNERSPEPSVELIYSGKEMTADELIEHYIQLSSAPSQLVVVSSDRAIQKAANRRRAIVWSSPKFARELGSALALWRELQGGPGMSTAEPSPTTVHMGSEQVIGWLRYFGFDADGQPLKK